MLAPPKKIKNDAIVEALLEIKFDSDDLNEVIVGRLSDLALWSNYTSTRLNVSNIPEAIRDSDTNLRYEPVIERKSQDSLNTVKIGSHVISYHVYAPYPGWETFLPKLISIIESLYDKTTNLTVRRLGLRYINFIRSTKHYLHGINELSLKVLLQDEQVSEGINLAYFTKHSDQHGVLLRLASPEFVDAIKPEDTVCVADVDVFTPNEFSTQNLQVVKDWISSAHKIEKESFFSLIPSDVLEKLKQE